MTDRSSASTPGDAPPPEAAPSAGPTAVPQECAPPGAPISFAHFLLSLASSVQVSLGLLPDPATGKVEGNLGAARQTIDLLGVLQEKTRGNLTPDEAGLLEELLYTLRMQYVEAGKQKSG